MGLRVRGEFTAVGGMLVTAVLRIQAKTKGDLTAKRAAGVERLHSRIHEAWAKASSLPLETAIARASLSRADFVNAGELLEGAVDAQQRETVLLELLRPHVVSVSTLFDEPIGEATVADQEIEAAKLRHMLSFFPRADELIMAPNSLAGEGKTISQALVTFGQWRTFMDQTGHRAPYCPESDYEKEFSLPKMAQVLEQHATDPVVGVDYSTDAGWFCRWLGRRVPTDAEFESAIKSNIFRPQSSLSSTNGYEWLADTNEGGQQLIRNPLFTSRNYADPGNREERLGFRVAEG